MNAHRCCHISSTGNGRKMFAAQNAPDGTKPPSFLRRCRDIAEWIIPGAILVLLPKCPLCLAAYIALVTGVGLSMSTLMYLRTTLVVLCVASLLCLATRSIQRARSQKA